MTSTTRIMALFTAVFTTLLTHVLALSIPVPTPAEPQANTNGLPGAVYRCFVDHFDDFHYVHGTDCVWVPPDEANKCYHGYLGSIGPDPGGYCKTYADWFCSEDQMMERFDFPGKADDIKAHWSSRCFKYGEGRLGA